jgi:plasmid rolling circle replication initiator protein Rep
MVTLNEGNPSEQFDLAEEVQRGFDESGKLPDRLKRYAFARERALLNLTQVYEKAATYQFGTVKRIRYDKVGSRLVQCGDYLVFKQYYTVGKVRMTAANFCMSSLLCPLCAIRRGSKNLEAYLQRFEIIKSEKPHLKLSMLTLTVKNGQDLAERFNHLKKSLNKMSDRRRKTLKGARGYHSEFAKIAGLVGSIEITKDGGLGEIKETGWHPHAHIMVLHSDRFDYVALQDEWLKITGDSHVLNVTAAKHPNDPAQDFLEVFKYALKFADLTPEQNIEAYEVMRGKHLLFSGGDFYGVDVPESSLDVELDELPYVELFYQYMAGTGYSLAKTFDSENLEPGQVRDKSYVTKTGYKPECSKTSYLDQLEVPDDISGRLQRDMKAIKEKNLSGKDFKRMIEL